jgi:hypothetical protein
MSIVALLAECRKRDIILTARDGQVLFDASAGALTPAIRAALAEHRHEVHRKLIEQDIESQLQRLVPYLSDNGRRCLIRRGLLLPERRCDLETVELVSRVLGRVPPAPPGAREGSG